MNVGSLFSGIGGLDLGLERAGMTVRWQSEIDPYCCKVLKKHWPHVPNLGDVTKIDWDGAERVDLVCGGFPCQPVSYSGKRLAQDDERWLWPEFARCLRGIRPQFVLVENVPGIITRGMGDVLGDLAALGFDAEWSVLPACAVGAPHSRERVFIVADADGARLEGSARGSSAARPPFRLASGGRDALAGRRSAWQASLDGVARAGDGFPRQVDRARALGNAVVPQVAQWIGERIMEVA